MPPCPHEAISFWSSYPSRRKRKRRRRKRKKKKNNNNIILEVQRKVQLTLCGRIREGFHKKDI